MKTKKLLLLFFSVLCLLFTAVAQNKHEIDSLKSLLVKLNTEKTEMRHNAATMSDTAIVNVLFQLWRNYWSNNPATAADYAEQGIVLSETIGFKKGEARAYNCLGIINYMKRDFAPALDNYKKALKIRIEINDKKATASTYMNIGNVQYIQGNYPLALENYLIALKIHEEMKFKQGIADACVNVGNVYYGQGNLKEALKYYLISLKINEEVGDKEGLQNAYINIGALYDAQGNYYEAIKAYSSSLKIAEELGDKNMLSDCYINLGSIYFKNGNYGEEMKSYMTALKIKEELGDKSGIATAYLNIGGIYIREKKYKDASDILNKALAISKEIESLVTIHDCYSRLTELDSAQGNFKQALENYKLVITTRDSLDNTEKAKKSLALQMQYDFDKKETATKAEQDVKDAEAKEEIQKQKTVKTGVSLGSGVLLLIMLLFINRRKAKHNLQVNKLENKTLRSQLNPHFIFNALASIQKYMNEHPELAQNYLAKFGKLMREVLENSEKEYISLEDEFAMLKKYMDLETLRVTNGFEYEFIIDKNADEETIRVPPLLFQPIIENAIWHGVANGATKGKITIRVVCENEMLKVEVENTASTSSATRRVVTEPVEVEKKKSFGLQIVKERLALLSKEKRRKGNLELIPFESGMIVKVEIPI